MAIKLNGVTVTSNLLNDSTVLVEKLNGTTVYVVGTTTLKWEFVGSFSSEPYNYDIYTSSRINGDYEAGIAHLDINYPAGDYHEGFVAVVADLDTLNFFEFVAVAI